jgi:predicted aspartyl protease
MIKGKFRRAALTGVTILALGFSASAEPLEQLNLPGYVGVQMTRGRQNHLTVPMQVNGKPANFLVDTGTDVSFFEATRGPAFNIAAQPEQVRRGGQLFPFGSIADLRAGGAVFGPTRVALYRIAQLRGSVPGPGGRPAEGVLGLDVLRRHRAVINCRTRQIFFQTDPAGRLDIGAATRGLGFARVGINEDRNGKLSVPCRLAARSGKLSLDTGSFVSGLDDDAARLLGLPTTPTRLTARSFDGRVRPVFLAQVNDLTIGGVTIAPQKLAVLDVFQKGKPPRAFTGLNRIEYRTRRDATREPELFGLLGNELLDQRRAIIDLGSMSLFLK